MNVIVPKVLQNISFSFPHSNIHRTVLNTFKVPRGNLYKLDTYGRQYTWYPIFDNLTMFSDSFSIIFGTIMDTYKRKYESNIRSGVNI